MLTQVNHWIEIAGVAVDALLLLRILQLRLYRIYLFITLACVVGLFFDSVGLWLGDSHESVRVFLYSRFLYAFIFPAASYDVWEEVKTQIARIRRLAMFRLVASLTLAAIFGLIIAGFAGNEENGSETLVDTFAVILWAAASTASLAFLWSLHRLARAQKVTLPNNTAVWLLFYQLSLAGEVADCFFIIIGAQFNTFVTDTLNISLNLYGILITLWCIWKLRALPSDVPSAPENASL
ncbi:MAG: hypothetical protein M3Y72_01210 [Acidobacteriota bacterium]|nr:hypothetical protein [Acidobacteriota bacterium]